MQSLPAGSSAYEMPPPSHIPCHCLLVASASEYNRMAVMCSMIRPPVLASDVPSNETTSGRPDNAWDARDCLIALQVRKYTIMHCTYILFVMQIKLPILSSMHLED